MTSRQKRWDWASMLTWGLLILLWGGFICWRIANWVRDYPQYNH